MHLLRDRKRRLCRLNGKRFPALGRQHRATGLRAKHRAAHRWVPVYTHAALTCASDSHRATIRAKTTPRARENGEDRRSRERILRYISFVFESELQKINYNTRFSIFGFPTKYILSFVLPPAAINEPVPNHSVTSFETFVHGRSQKTTTLKRQNNHDTCENRTQETHELRDVIITSTQKKQPLACAKLRSVPTQIHRTDTKWHCIKSLSK